MSVFVNTMFRGLFFFMIFAIYVATPIVIAVVFYKSMVTGEGYLTHTLPVTTKQLVWSKTLAGVLNTVITVVIDILLLGTYYLAFQSQVNAAWKSAKKYLILDMGKDGGKMIQDMYHFLVDKHIVAVVVMIIIFVLILVAKMFSSLLTYYAMVSVGQMARKHKIIAMIGFYIGFTTLLQYIISVIAYGIMMLVGPHMKRMSPITLAMGYEVGLLVISILLSVVCYIISVHSFRKKLNLE